MICSRMEKLMYDQKISNIKMGEFVGVSDTIVGRWKKGKAFPTSENLSKIADCLGCSADYLLGRTDNPVVDAPVSELSEDERELLSYFRQLDNKGRRHVLSFAEDECSALVEKGKSTASA